MNTALAEHLRNARHKSGLSIEQAAALSDLPAYYVGMCEQGTIKIPARLAEHLLATYRVAASDGRHS